MPKKTQKKEKIKLDVSNHILVPKHSKLSDKEKKELFEKYGLSIKELPKILIGDASLIGIEVRPGDVIKITRKSPTAGNTTFYRGVVDG